MLLAQPAESVFQAFFFLFLRLLRKYVNGRNCSKYLLVSGVWQVKEGIETGPLAMAADTIMSIGVISGPGIAHTRARFHGIFPRHHVLRSQAALCSFLWATNATSNEDVYKWLGCK